MSDTPNHESDAIEEMISTLVQIAWDAGNQEEEAIFDDEYNQIYDRLLQCINTKDTEIKRLEERDEVWRAKKNMLQEENAQLMAEVERLKCCGNCKAFSNCHFVLGGAVDIGIKLPASSICDKWEDRK